MAEPHSQSVNYSALPVFSGEALAVTPPSELMAPRHSAIPLLVGSPRTTRRHVSAHTGSPKEPIKMSMPKSQSMRNISTKAPPPSGYPLRVRPRQPSNSSSANTSVSSISSANSSNQSTTSFQSELRRVPRTTSTNRISDRRRPLAVPSAAPSCASASTAASEAKKITRSPSSKVSQKPPPARRIPMSASTRSLRLAGETQSQSTVPVAGPVTGQQHTQGQTYTHSNANASHLPNQSAKIMQTQSHQHAHASAYTHGHIPAQHTHAKAPVQSHSQSLHNHAGNAGGSSGALGRSHRVQPTLQSTRRYVSNPASSTTSTTTTTINQPVTPAQPRKVTPSSSRLPKMVHSQSMPFNLAMKNKIQNNQAEREKRGKGSLKLDMGLIPRSIKTLDCDLDSPLEMPGSNPSSRSSSRSLSRATQKFLDKIRSATSSRASSRTPTEKTSSGPTPLDGREDDWEELVVEREPSEQIKDQLALISPSATQAGASLKIDASTVNAPLSGASLSNTASNLTPSEHVEILDYKQVYFSGKPGILKNKSNFTDENGNYRHVLNDHIAYRYEILAELGKGSFGKVFKCQDHKSGRMIAIKITCNRKEMRRQARVEAQILQNLLKAGNTDKHHFLRYLGSFTFRDHFCICTEILGINLYELLRRTKYKGLDYDLVRYITRQLVDGLEFLDLQGIIHCDLKPENILISDQNQCQVKIIDFGSGCYETNRVYTYIQSRFYRAPEILLGMPYSTAIDMWSLGCIIPELILGRPLFPGEDEADQIACLAQTLGAPDQFMLKSCSRANIFFDAKGNPLKRRSPDGIVRGVPGSKSLNTMLPPTAADFVSKILQWSPHKRLSAGGALYHDFILGI